MKQFLHPKIDPSFVFPLLLEESFLQDLPPATIVNALHDPLCDHGTEYFKKLQKAGVPVTHSIYGTSIHGFFGSQIGESDEAIMEICIALQNAFQTSKVIA